MNLNKKYKKQKLVDRIICDDITYRGQKEVSAGITGFYQKLYNAGDTIQDDDNEFYQNCPSISQGSKELMETDLTDLELLAALKSCSDSAPGSDGIPYSVYKNYG